MREIVSTIPIESYRDTILAAAPGFQLYISTDLDALAPHLANAEILITARPIPIQAALAGGKLRWVQSWSAGYDTYPLAEMKKKGVLLTNSSGVHGPQIAQTVFAMLLAFARGLYLSIPDRTTGLWRTKHSVYELPGQTLGILGMGAIGREVARLAAGFSMRVVGLRAHAAPAEGFDTVYGPDQLHEMLSECDAVVNALPMNPETHRLMNAGALAAMRPGSVYISIGRGGTTDQDALVHALREGPLAFAGLDVTDPEPLPSDSPLWTLPNVILTPHIAGQSPHYYERAIAIFLENLKTYLEEGAVRRNLIRMP